MLRLVGTDAVHSWQQRAVYAQTPVPFKKHPLMVQTLTLLGTDAVYSSSAQGMPKTSAHGMDAETNWY